MGSLIADGGITHHPATVTFSHEGDLLSKKLLSRAARMSRFGHFADETEEEDIPSSKCLGFVQTLDTMPKRRLFEVLKSQGLQMNQQLTFLPDGGDTVRDLQLYMSPEAEHL
jgi:hypothetical protein